jgi:hypothetical protein
VQWKHFGADEATWKLEDDMIMDDVLNTEDNVSLRGSGM